MKTWLALAGVLAAAGAAVGAEPVVYQTRTAADGAWSDPTTWEANRVPRAGDIVQVRSGHRVVYDVESDVALRMVHVAGTLAFSRERSTRLVVGLLKVEPGDTTTEDGFDCADPAALRRPALQQHGDSKHDGHHGKHQAADPTSAALEIGTRAAPIPRGVTATIRLRQFPGTNPETLPAIVVCGGRWDVHGAPLARTWLKLAAPAKSGDVRVTVEQPVEDWQVGDRIIITTGEFAGLESGNSFQKRPFGRQKPVGTEERLVTGVEGAVITLDRPLDKPHRCEGMMRCEAANLSRNVVVESAEPEGVRGHTLYHHGSTGGISYAEFRHLGKADILGKYAIHFHLVRDTMRGSGVTGASIWDSHNRWITIHGSDHLLVRDCVGYQSRGHGYFLEDATEQWNVLDRNLAVQAFSAVSLPKQVLPYDPNDGAGFWWANGRNTFTRNVACENDRYGYHFQIAKTPDFNPHLEIREPDGKIAKRDVRTVPLLRFEDNESHGEGLFDFRFGDEEPGAVRGDREHPFVVRNLRAWHSHYVIRPNVSYFLLERLRAEHAAFGIYHPNYDFHVYRDVVLDNVTAEPLNGGHDEKSVPLGDVTFDRLTLAHCRGDRDPLIQLTRIAPTPGLVGHFRGITLQNSGAGAGEVIDFGGGPRTKKTEHVVEYYFHDLLAPGEVARVVGANGLAIADNGDSRDAGDWTGRDVRLVAASNIHFPELLAPVDDVPPATLITLIEFNGGKRTVRGVAHDNGEVASVTVNGRTATIRGQQAGVADWVVELDALPDGCIVATAVDREGNEERTPHVIHNSFAR